MELGRHLVRELGLEDGVDTLSRWMAHHLAELIDAAENGATAEDRLQAQVRATETILKIWERRASLPHNAYPLARYADILQVLARLRPDANPWVYLTDDPQATRERLAADLFDSFTRLIIALLWSKMPADVGDKTAEAPAVNALSETERHIVRSLESWYEFFLSMHTGTDRARKRKKSSESPEETLDEMAVQFIDHIVRTLAQLRSELQPSPSSTEDS